MKRFEENDRQNKKQTRILVVGAGISGLYAAILLAKRGANVEVWDSSRNSGGLLAPVPFCNVPCDLGSHRIHPEAFSLLKNALPDYVWEEQIRRGVLVFRDRHLSYPLYLPSFLQGLGFLQSLKFAWSFLRREASFTGFLQWEKERVRENDDQGFEAFVSSRTGRSAFEAFYQPYAEKVWGIPTTTLSQIVAKKRISTSEPFRVLKESISYGNNIKKFLYPRLGMGNWIKSLEKQAISLGVSFKYQMQFTREKMKQPLPWDSILYGGRISDLLAKNTLHHRGLYLVYLSFPKESLGKIDTFYVPEKKYWFGRVSIPANFSSSLKQRGETILCVEIPEGNWGEVSCFAQKNLARLLAQLVAARIIPSGLIPNNVKQVFLPCVYPLYRRGWYQTWQNAMKEIAGHKKIFPIGRQGLFLHCNIDHCIRVATEATEHITQEKSSLVWCERAKDFLELRVRD